MGKYPMQYVYSPRSFDVVSASNSHPMLAGSFTSPPQNFGMDRGNYVPVLARRNYPYDSIAAASSGGYGCGGCCSGSGGGGFYQSPCGCGKSGSDFFDLGDLLTLGALALLGLILLFALFGTTVTGRRRKRGMILLYF